MVGDGRRTRYADSAKHEGVGRFTAKKKLETKSWQVVNLAENVRLESASSYS